MDSNILLDLKEYIERNTGEKLTIDLPCIKSDNPFNLPDIGCCEDRVTKILSEEEIKRILGHSSDTLVEFLWFLIRENNLDLNEFVTKNNLSKELLTDYKYEVSKEESIKIALLFKMNMEDTLSFIGRCYHFINKKDIFDLIIRYSINNNIYDINVINEVLKAFKQNTI